MWLLNKMLSALVKQGQLRVIDHDGTEYRYGDLTAEPVTIRFTDKGAALHVAKDPRVGAGEAYMDGRLVVEPPHDIRDMVLLVMGNANRGSGIGAPNPLKRGIDWIFAKADQINLRTKASSNVTHHYDLTRQFYELFLDENRLYTMAYFTDPGSSLEQAQIDKKTRKKVCEISWKCQQRLFAKCGKLSARKKMRQKVQIAMARELCGFVWAVLREATPAGTNAPITSTATAS